jgi:acyl-CoA dehydrogenase
MFDHYFDESHRILRESIRKFVQREIHPYVDEWEDAEEFPRELYGKMAAAGFVGLGYPEELGGTPADEFHKIVFAEEIIRSGSMGLAAGLGSHGIALPPILKVGTDEQRQRFVPPVLRGEKIAALGITEPNAGSDVANIQTRAERDGDHYIVNGAKTFITSGCRADIVTTAVRTGGPGAAGVSLLVIETDTPGFRVTKKIRKMGWNASDTGELSFENVRVPVANRIGNENEGFRAIMVNFQSERLAMAVQAMECAQLAYEEALKYSKQREAFGRPLAGFQVTRHKLADMITRITAARALNYSLAARVQAGEYLPAEVSMAKNFSCDVCDKAVFDAVQIHGGYGFAREFLVERLYRDSRIMSLGGGTREIMNEIISKQLKY